MVVLLVLLRGASFASLWQSVERVRRQNRHERQGFFWPVRGDDPFSAAASLEAGLQRAQLRSLALAGVSPRIQRRGAP